MAKKVKVIWESIIIDAIQKKVFYKTDDYRKHFTHVSFDSLRNLDSKSPEHHHIFKEIIYTNYPESFI
jgi:hypothetical protein